MISLFFLFICLVFLLLLRAITLIFCIASNSRCYLSRSFSSSPLISSKQSVQYQASFGTESNFGFRQNIWNPQLHLSHSNNYSSSYGVFSSHILHIIFSKCSSHFSYAKFVGFNPKYPLQLYVPHRHLVNGVLYASN